MKRRILFDLGHPGHFHLFKNAIDYFKDNPDYQVFITTRNIPIIKALLEASNFTYCIIGSKRNGFFGKMFSVLETDFQMLLFVLKNKIELGIHCGIVLSHVSLFTKMRSWIFDDDDDDVEPLMVNFSHPLSEFVFTPDCIKRKVKRAIYYPGTHELSYLYDGLERLDNTPVRYSIVRLVAFNGHHDSGHSGLNEQQLIQLVGLLEEKGNVFITSEKKLAGRWEKYRINVSYEKMHQLMSGAMIVVGDSQTMISEAATMGVPAFKCNSFAGMLAVPNMLEREYELCSSYKPNEFDLMLREVETVLNRIDSIAEYKGRLNRFKKEKINPTKLMVYCIEQWELDFNRIKDYKREEWLSLCSNIDLCPKISPSPSIKSC